jgi:hypothetical protein
MTLVPLLTDGVTALEPEHCPDYGAHRTSCIQRPPHGIEQGIGPERLSEERDRAGLQGSLARFVVTESRQNDRRNSGARGRQVPEQIEATHPVHPQVEHQSAGVLLLAGAQELFRRCERFYSEADRCQEIPEGPTQ